MSRWIVMLMALGVAQVASAAGSTNLLKQRFDRARERYQQRDFAGAAAELRASYEILAVGAIGTAAALWSAFSEKGPPSTGREVTGDLSAAPYLPPRAIVVPTLGPRYAGVAAELRF